VSGRCRAGIRPSRRVGVSTWHRALFARHGQLLELIFGPMIAAALRKRRLRPHTTWHLDEGYLRIDGRMVYLWRAGDAEGEVLDVLVQSKRNKHAALKLMGKLLKKYAFVPERLVNDDLRSYSAAARDLVIERRNKRGRWKNNRAENSHQPTRQRERKMQRFKSPGFSPEISFHARRLLQHFQRPTPSHFSPNAPRPSRCGDDHVADRSCSSLTISEPPLLRARRTAM
jgi:transposase-like protein